VHIEGIITFINPYGAQLLGYDQSAQLLGIHVMDLVDTDSRDIATSHLRTTVHDRQPISPAEICSCAETEAAWTSESPRPSRVPWPRRGTGGRT